MVKWVVLSILLLPFLELGVFALVASVIGLGWALGLALATSVAGLLVLKAVGRGRLMQLRVAASDPELAAFQAVAGGMLVVLGGLLLLLPGFVTDAVGALFLLPPVRRWCAAALRRAARNRRGRGGKSGGKQGVEVVDLEPEEWARVPEPRLERQRAAPQPSDRDSATLDNSGPNNKDPRDGAA